MIDAVASYHTNPLTCGVAKWNMALAKRLAIPHVSMKDASQHQCPLISAKFSEWVWQPTRPRTYALFVHDAPAAANDWQWVIRATAVYTGNAEIADLIRTRRADVITAWCPSTVDGDASRGTYRVLCFGMAHKLQLAHYRKLKETLDTAHPGYTMSLSTAVHEGNPWDAAMTASIDGMREIFGDQLRVLGYLGDDALAAELQACDAVACFYEPAFRANNTSAWTCLGTGKTFYTNLDEFSPEQDLQKYSWPKLVELLTDGA